MSCGVPGWVGAVKLRPRGTWNAARSVAPASREGVGRFRRHPSTVGKPAAAASAGNVEWLVSAAVATFGVDPCRSARGWLGFVDGEGDDAAVSANLAQVLDKAWEDKSLTEVLAAPVDALQGVSAGDAEALRSAFNVRTVGDLGRNKFFRAAQALALLGDAGAK